MRRMMIPVLICLAVLGTTAAAQTPCGPGRDPEALRKRLKEGYEEWRKAHDKFFDEAQKYLRNSKPGDPWPDELWHARNNSYAKAAEHERLDLALKRAERDARREAHRLAREQARQPEPPPPPEPTPDKTIPQTPGVLDKTVPQDPGVLDKTVPQSIWKTLVGLAGLIGGRKPTP